MKFSTLSPEEERIMIHIWNNGFLGSYGETIAQMSHPHPTKTKFAAVVGRLCKKKFITSVRSFIPDRRGYFVSMPIELYQRMMMDKLVCDLFGNNYKDLLAFMIESRKLKAGDLKEALAFRENMPTD